MGHMITERGKEMKTKLLKKIRKVLEIRYVHDNKNVAVIALNHQFQSVVEYSSISEFVVTQAMAWLGIGSWSSYLEKRRRRKERLKYFNVLKS